MNILCVICARGGSQGLKNKNILKIKGKPLIHYTLDIAKKSKLYSKIVVSSDSNKILKKSKKYKPDLLLKRPKFLATPFVSKIKVIRHALKQSENEFGLNFDYIVDLDVTSPFRTLKDLKLSLKKIIDEKSEVLISAIIAKKNPYFNMVEYKKNNKLDLVKKSKKQIFSRQMAPMVYDMNASIYIWKRDCLLKSEIFGKKTSIYIMPPERSIDIDSKLDFKIVKFLMKKNQR